MARTIDKRIMLNLIIEAKKTDPEAGPFSEWLAEYLVDHLPTLTPPNEPLTLEQLRETDKVPIYVVTEKRGKGWCILSWHGVNESFTFFSKTGTLEGITAVPLSASTYGDRWLAYRRPPENDTESPLEKQ